MTPDEIRSLIAKDFPALVAEARSNPDGWSFYLDPPIKGNQPNRILRAVRSSPQASTKLKCAVSLRLGLSTEIRFSGSAEALRKIVERELVLFENHFSNRTKRSQAIREPQLTNDKATTMSNRLENKTAFVTAAGQGIGRAVALAFAREGASVIATDLNPKLLEALAADAKGLTLRTQVLDVLDAAAIQAAAKQHATVDILFNGAGFVHHGTVLDCTEEEWDFAFDLNVRSMYRTIRAFVPGMLARGNGSIINVASGASSIKAAANRFVYGATKAAVIGLTKAVALDYITKGVRCNAICPGTIESPSLRDRIATLAKNSGQSEQQVEAMFIGRQPMGRLGTADEVAALAVHLAGDESRFTTGTTALVDGGWSL